jgi:TonB family protein
LSISIALLLAPPSKAESPRSGTAEVRITNPAIKVDRIHYAAPQYPSVALQQGLSGFVTIEFVVNTKGQPVGLKVVDALPARVFERSVLMAAKRWRYKPLVVDNVPRERPLRTIIRFETPT